MLYIFNVNIFHHITQNWQKQLQNTQSQYLAADNSITMTKNTNKEEDKIVDP